MVSGGLVAIGGFLGAVCRFAISNWLSRRTKSAFPYATLLVNLAGSLLLGVLYGASDGEGEAALLWGIGFLGAFTTFSTFSYEGFLLLVEHKWRNFAVYLSTSLAAGVALAFVGYWLGGGLA